ncbi:hypothetical protein SAMN05661091_4716 [Paenibacillus uliginis N3/975]|uniref:Uncharacterized protein n=1 Tax=Paenibacillus uliginis N3/975 TaxID=1313296 RepID=A0A1X7HNS9_9BACL|nr:hypothetical protein [Paenibacillus uliginis]SMF89621.1 hypothetical protein SAMN05661091_4716 [Paenibacillus uliginis N3/975]
MGLYFKDNFFNSGETSVMNEAGEIVGTVDLKSSFGSSLDVYDETGMKVYSGSFRFFSNKWEVCDRNEYELGVLRMRMSFFSKKYEYDAGERGIYEITSPAFSKEYEIQGEGGRCVATFHRVSGWLQSGAYHLKNDSQHLDDWELIAVVMGVHAIQKRVNSSGSSAST